MMGEQQGKIVNFLKLLDDFVMYCITSVDRADGHPKTIIGSIVLLYVLLFAVFGGWVIFLFFGLGGLALWFPVKLLLDKLSDSPKDLFEIVFFQIVVIGACLLWTGWIYGDLSPDSISDYFIIVPGTWLVIFACPIGATLLNNKDDWQSMPSIISFIFYSATIALIGGILFNFEVILFNFGVIEVLIIQAVFQCLGGIWDIVKLQDKQKQMLQEEE